MVSVQARYHKDRTYEAVEAITGGKLVEARANAGRTLPGAGIAAAGSLKVLGVAQKDASAPQTEPRVPAAGVLDVTLAPSEFEVINDDFVNVTYTAAAAYGDRLIAAATGNVTPAGAAPDARTVVGWCAEKDGVAAGAVGLARINV